LSGGNRCGHDPRRPRLELERPGTRGKPFPWLIGTGLERFERLYHDRSLFPELGPRKRSERIEAMVLVGKAILRNTDRLTLRSGRRNFDGSFTGITMKSIASWGRISVQRAYRAVWDLRDAGYVDLHQPIERRADGSRRGLAGIRRVTPLLFERLGLRGRLMRERRELWKAARAHHQSTIAERRRLRRLFKASRRASVLTERTTHQLAEAAAPAPAPRTYTPAELAERLERWRRGQ